MEIKYRLPLLAVQDVERSKSFYGALFGQKVSLDLGKNVTFDGGFAVQEDFAWLTGLEPASVVSRSHNMELYFEVDDFDIFLARVEGYGGVELAGPPKEQEWKQRVVRLYDPDGHLIEVGEDMGVIARRYLAAGHSAQEVAALIQHPLEFVEEAAAQKAFE